MDCPCLLPFLTIVLPDGKENHSFQFKAEERIIKFY